MSKTIQLAVCLSAAGLLAPTMACKKPQAPMPASEPAKQPLSPYIGLWEGTTKKGETCTVMFTATNWECNIEDGGIPRPYYRGTYTHAGSRIDLTITQEGDIKTMGWVAQKGNLEPNIIGRLANGRLTIKALTDAELARKH